MAYNAARGVMGGQKRRRGGRKKTVKSGKRGAKVKLKIKGTPEQVNKAVKRIALSGQAPDLSNNDNF